MLPSALQLGDDAGLEPGGDGEALGLIPGGERAARDPLAIDQVLNDEDGHVMLPSHRAPMAQ